MLALLLLACIENELVGQIAPPRPNANPPPVAPTERTDRFLQVVHHEVDVLWIIDNSPSINEDRALLTAAFPDFIEWFQEIEADWHVGVITTDMDSPGHQGALQARDGYLYIDPTTPDPVQVFEDMVLGISGSTLDERGRDAAWTATEPLRDTTNAGFLHESELAWLHFTVVSDEDDDSEQIAVQQFADYVNFIRPFADRTTWNSIVALTDTGTEEIGKDYLTLTYLLGGTSADLNNPSWPDVIRDLGGTQAPAPIVEFFLSARPVPGTVEVKVIEPSGVVRTFLPHQDWIWSEPRNSVLFVTYVPALGSVVEVHYQLAAA